jgi:dTDP-4-amino-4,6-dideoxygalactose transaminase
MLPYPTSVSVLPVNMIPAQGNGRRFARRKRRLVATLTDVIDAGLNTGKYVQGSYVRAFERLIEERWQVAAAVAVNSGSAALRLAFEALHIEAGREVLVPALTFISTAYAVHDAGLVPVFVDIDPHTFTLDPAAVDTAISEKTAAMVPVHVYGQMADMTPLLDLADAYGLYVVEDAAQAHGATYTCDFPSMRYTYYAGSMGDLGCFSLNGVKNMGGLGDAGLITISPRLAARRREITTHLRGMRDLGRFSTQRYVHETWGLRARMDEFSAAECLQELSELDRWNERRREIASRYTAALANSPLQAPITAPGRQHVYFTYAVLSPSLEAREELERVLQASGVEVAEAYTLVPDQTPYRTGKLPCRIAGLKEARQVMQRITHIPLYPELEEAEIDRIVAVLEQVAALN